MRFHAAYLILMAGLLPCMAQSPAGPAPVFRVGGVSITLPAPDSSFAEVGAEHRSTIFELFVPTENRLISAYVPSKELADLDTDKPRGATPTYGMIEVARRAESLTCGPSEFKQVTDGASESMGSMMSSVSGNVEAEMNRRLAALDLGSVSLGETKPIGGFFSKPNSYGFGMVTVMSAGGQSGKMAIGGFLTRVRDKLLFGYLYTEYKGTESALWLKTTTERWADAITAANK